MDNIFKKTKSHSRFEWANLGDIAEGRKDLGTDMPVIVYRLMQFTLHDVLTEKFGGEKVDEFFREAGHLAGTAFAGNLLDLSAGFDEFIAQLQRKLQELRIGILRMEKLDSETGEIVLTVGEDLDCSGLPVTGETVCSYDEGFLAGVLEAYTGTPYKVQEIDCWANGARVCRFKGVK
jgi:predicted hydrocarbon binding protein